MSKSTILFSSPPSISGKEGAMATCPAILVKAFGWPLIKSKRFKVQAFKYCYLESLGL